MSEWMLTYDGWDAEREPLREALCTLGNGYVATRGAAEERTAGGAHYPGTYFAGGYDRLPTEIAGRVIENEDLVNWPNWLPLTFRAGDGEWLDLDRWQLLEQRWTLDLHRGVLVRRLRVRDPDGRITSVRSRRLVHMGDPHVAALEWELTTENWSGPLVVRTALDGTVVNSGVARYRELNSQHLHVLHEAVTADGILELLVRTAQSRLQVAMAARTTIYADGGREMPVQREALDLAGYVGEELHVATGPGRALRIEKVVGLFTSRDHALSDPLEEAKSRARTAPAFAELLRTHALAWKRLWHRCDIDITGHADTQLILRLHVFHLLQTVSPHSIDLDVGVPARGWHGEAYRGHIFWDELFIFPFLNLRVPEITRALLMYRYRRLREARRRARSIGKRGALFPWQSGSNGREETQVLHLNPRSGRWLPDNSHRQYHVNSAIAYNVWQYYQVTEDHEFLAFYGAELILEIARFWADLATFNEETKRYDIRGVMGPDEFHDAYPGASEGGLDNNTYTNVMAAWVLERASEVLELLPEDRRRELCDELELVDGETARWRDVASRLTIPFHDGIPSQFEGYEQLQELDWDAYRERHDDIHRLDRILEAEGDSTNHYRLSKQADVLMLFYLFSAEELEGLFRQLGYDFDPEQIPRIVHYYLERTSHGSTLSSVVHAWVLARVRREGAWELFERALESDVNDVQGGTTAEGIHLGAMAGTVDIVQRCFLGISTRDDVLWLDPRLPRQLEGVRVSIRYRGQWLSVHATHDALTVTFRQGRGLRTRIGVDGEVLELGQGEERTFRLPGDERRGGVGIEAGAMAASQTHG